MVVGLFITITTVHIIVHISTTYTYLYVRAYVCVTYDSHSSTPLSRLHINKIGCEKTGREKQISSFVDSNTISFFCLYSLYSNILDIAKQKM